MVISMSPEDKGGTKEIFCSSSISIFLMSFNGPSEAMLSVALCVVEPSAVPVALHRVAHD